MTDQKLIDDVVTAFADRDIDAPSRDDIARVLDVFETSLRRCGCDACTTARQERIGLTEHDITSLARVLHEVVYSPGASFDRAVPGIQEYMHACAEKVAAALPWVVPTPEVELVKEEHTPTDDEREAQANRYVAGRGDSQTRRDFLAGWDAALRRSEVPEPSRVAEMIEQSSFGTPEAQELRATVSDEKARALVDEANRRSEPQGEPSDAVIVDMLSAFYDEERDGWSMGKVRRMRAALRAAGEVTR